MILSKPYIIKELEGLAGNGLTDGAAVDRHASRRLRLRTTEAVAPVRHRMAHAKA